MIMMIIIVMMVILMIMMTTITQKHTYIMTFQPKCTNFRDFYLVKKGHRPRVFLMKWILCFLYRVFFFLCCFLCVFNEIDLTFVFALSLVTVQLATERLDSLQMPWHQVMFYFLPESSFLPHKKNVDKSF